MYAQDSFFSLTVLGQVGLLAVSLCLAAFFLLLSTRLKGPWWVRLFGALALGWLFVWLSPQAYYQYYHLLFPDLPDQWVIKPPPGPVQMFSLLTFTKAQTMAAHSAGALLWLCILAAFWKNLHLRRNAAN